MTVNQQDRALIDAVITLGKGYKMQVVAEGVETEVQLNILREFNCDIIQGRWLSMPISAPEFEKFLQKLYPCHDKISFQIFYKYSY